MTAVTLAGAAVALLVGLGALVLVVSSNWRGGQGQRLERDLRLERESHASTRAERDDARANLRDERSKVADCHLQIEQQQANNQSMQGKLEAYDRIFGMIEGPIHELSRKVEANQTILNAHNESAMRGIRRIVALLVDLMRLEGDKRSATSILAETEDRDL